ncbi:MAG: glycosyltransferase family 9 protein, partial [Candidatus Zixiibacteriota bacterium]
MKKFYLELRSQNYDWIIDNHGIFKSGLLVILSRGKRKIGFKPSRGIAEEGNYLFTNERYKPLEIERHALERYLDLIAQLGVPVNQLALEYQVPADSRRRAEAILYQNGFSSHPLVVIHPMAKWPTKQWPAENFASLAETLTNKGVSVVFTGSAEDKNPVQEILGRTKTSKRMLNLVGQTGLKE